MPNRVEIADSTGAAITSANPLSVNATLGGAAAPIGAGLEATALRVTLPTDGTGVVKLGSGTAAIGSLTAGTAHIGQVKTPIQYVTVDMTAEPTGLDVGDVTADTQVVTNATQANDVLAVLHSITLIDVDDQKAKLNLVFFDANTSLGTEDSAPDIDDTEVQTVIGVVSITASDYVDLGVNSVVNLRNVGLIVKPAAGTRNIYMAIYSPDTSAPTYATGHIYVRLGFM